MQDRYIIVLRERPGSPIRYIGPFVSMSIASRHAAGMESHPGQIAKIVPLETRH